MNGIGAIDPWCPATQPRASGAILAAPMLETLTQGFTAARERLSGLRDLTDQNTDEALRDVRMSLLEADVDFEVVKGFLARVKQRVLGEKVGTRVRDSSGRLIRVTPGQHFVKACEEELTELMGPVDPTLARGPGGVISVMLVGLQGVGKTTVAAKLARFLQREKRRPLLVAADVYRPAAILQLQQLGERLEAEVHAGTEGEKPADICAGAVARARAEGFDAIVYDTAGRLAIDEVLMEELQEITRVCTPANTLLVCDALMGRDAVNVAKAFSEKLDLDGLVLTKLDGDARGGAALAIKAVTGVPIKFLGTGEALDRLEPFRPEGLASRILGMGDIVGLVRDFEEVVDEREAEADAERLLRGRFGLEDLLKQLRTIQKLGPLQEVIAKVPMFGGLAEHVDEQELSRVEALIHSMTPDERAQPELIDKSRASRIARGSGRRSKDVRDLIDRFVQMRDVMAGLGKQGGLLSKVPGMGRLAGAGMPDGVDPAGLMAGMGGGGGGPSRRSVAKKRAHSKGKRKQARKARRKNRRR
jgi:signal recognition particle subunit SRP54